MRKYTCVDLFSGAGGLSLGFMNAGFDVLLGVDYNDAALKTFAANHGNAIPMKLDLFNHDNINRIIDFLTERNVSLDVLVGGPPCQGFSIAGPRDMNDKRNSLYVAMVKLAERIRPRVVVLENVPGMIQTNDGIGAKRIINDFSSIGYDMTPKLLYAPDYGIPQIRKRVFFVGIRKDEASVGKFEFPLPTFKSSEYISCSDAIGDLPSLQKENGEIIYGEEVQDYICAPQNDFQRLMRTGSRGVYNHIGSIPIEKTRQMIALIPEGKNYRALPDEYRKLYKYHEASVKPTSASIINTIDTKTKLAIGKRAKAEAVKYITDQGIALTKSVSYAVRQTGKSHCWANPQSFLLDDDWSFILNDTQGCEMIVLHIPKGSLVLQTSSKPGLRVRKDKPDLIDIKIDLESLVDTVSKIDFSKYVQTRIKY